MSSGDIDKPSFLNKARRGALSVDQDVRPTPFIKVLANALATGGAGTVLWATSPTSVGKAVTYAAGTGLATIQENGVYQVELNYQNTNTGAITLEVQKGGVYVDGTRVDVPDDGDAHLVCQLTLAAGDTISIRASAATTSEANTDSYFSVRQVRSLR